MLRPEFAVRRTGERYNRDEVDQLVDRLLATIDGSAGPSVTVRMLRNAGFGRPLLGAGYAADQVDDFLVLAEAWLPKDQAQRPAEYPPFPRPGVVPSPGAGNGPQRPQFNLVRFQEGYDPAEVDEFVDRVMATVTGQPTSQPITVQDVQNVQFTPVRFREGYSVEDVDAWLDTVQAWLQGH
ncbi:DivIVA domain-containing protein [Kribbella deserti]|uniref:Cell wall synthesis protein Wag31 n=1 Tax=Kribbella deserti TaxID=1926257 RepID=A0ABV6QW13_9ACTN